MAGKKDIAIIGAGKVGTAIGVLAVRAGWRVKAVADAKPAVARKTARAIGFGARECSSEQAAASAGLVLLTVPDGRIAPLCRELAEAGAFVRGGVVAHCCGALAGDVLAPAKKLRGCRVGSIHPLQTFPTVRAAIDRMPWTYFFCEGDRVAIELLERFARSLGGVPVRIAPRAKALYHAAAVMASNHLVAVLDAASAMAARAGIGEKACRAAIGPLVRATLENVLEMGPAKALTGPVARGDAETIARHLEAMKGCPRELREFYRAAAVWTVGLARRKGTLGPNAARSIVRLLHGRV